MMREGIGGDYPSGACGCPGKKNQRTVIFPLAHSLALSNPSSALRGACHRACPPPPAAGRSGRATPCEDQPFVLYRDLPATLPTHHPCATARRAPVYAAQTSSGFSTRIHSLCPPDRAARSLPHPGIVAKSDSVPRQATRVGLRGRGCP